MKPALTQQATRTTNGTQNWTDTSITSDQTLQFFFGTEATANDTTTTAAKLFLGATDLVNNIAHCIGTIDATAAASANSASIGSSTKCLMRTTSGGGENLTASLSAVLSNGITLTQGVSDGGAYLFNGLSLAGSDHVSHLSNTGFATGDASKVIPHGDSSPPDAIMVFATVGQGSTDATSGNPMRTIVAFWDGTSSVSTSMKCSSLVSPTDLAQRIVGDSGHQLDASDTDVATLSITAVNATTFTLNRTATGTTAMFVTCISIRHTSGGWAFKAGITTLPTVGGNSPLITGMSVTPQVLFTVATRLTSTSLAANSDSAGSMSFGVACNNNGTTQQAACAMTMKNGVTTTIAKCRTSASQALLSLDNTGAVVNAATVNSWNSDGVTLNHSSVGGSAYEVMYFAFGAGTIPVGDTEFDVSSKVYEPKKYKSALQEFWQMPLAIRSIISPTPLIAAQDFTPLRGRSFPASLRGIELNLLESTLFGQDRVLCPPDWNYGFPTPLERMPTSLRDDSYPLTALELTALTTFAPYTEYNWPLPQIARRLNQGFEFSVPLPLLGKDQILLSGPQNNMWDPPAGKLFPISLRLFDQSGLALFNSIPLKPPLSISDWPVPKVRPRPVQDFIAGTPTVILSFLTLFPRVSYTYENPRRKSYGSSLFISDGVNLALTQTIVSLPPGDMSFELLAKSQPKFSSLYQISLRSQFLTPILPPPPTAPGQVAGPGGRTILMPKKQGETVSRPFDFISRLGPTEIILNAVVTASVYSGIDTNPQSIIYGGASVIGTTVFQFLTGGNTGVIYELLCKAQTSLGQTLEMAAFWVVEPDLP